MKVSNQIQRAGSARLIILSVLFVLALGVSAWIWMRPRTQPSLDAGQKIATAFLDQIRGGHPDLAWESTTADFKSDHGKEAFVKSLKPLKSLKQPAAFVSVQTVTLQEQPRNEYLFRSEDGQTFRILIGRETGEWKVDRFSK